MSIVSIYERLSNFQDEDVKIEKSKSAHNYKYAPLDDIVPIVKPLLKKHGMIITHKLSSTEKGDNVVESFLVNIENPKDFLSCRTEVTSAMKIGSMNAMMVIGAQITYIRRYHVVSLLGLTTESDTDVNASSGSSGKVAPSSNKPNYVAIFTNQLQKGVTETVVRKSFENYKKNMEPKDIGAILSMIEDKFKK